MEAGYGPARYRYENEREDLAGYDGPAPVHELRHGRHPYLGREEYHPQREDEDGAYLHVGREVVPGREQEPYGQDGGQEAVNYERQDQEPPAVVEIRGEGRAGYEMPRRNRDYQQYDAYDRDLAYPPRPYLLHVHTHEERNGYGEEYRERAPGRTGQGVDEGEAEPGERDGYDEDYGYSGGAAGYRAYLVSRYPRKRFSVPADGGDEDDEVVNRPGEDRADEYPERARQVPELG